MNGVTKSRSTIFRFGSARFSYPCVRKSLHCNFNSQQGQLQWTNDGMEKPIILAWLVHCKFNSQQGLTGCQWTNYGCDTFTLVVHDLFATFFTAILTPLEGSNIPQPFCFASSSAQLKTHHSSCLGKMMSASNYFTPNSLNSRVARICPQTTMNC